MLGAIGGNTKRDGLDAVMNYSESPVVFNCESDRLIGVVAKPVDHLFGTGVVIVVGGPQYRAGSHRQFTLLARELATTGIASLRFDYRGMGDSEGSPSRFDAVDDDIAVAIDTLVYEVKGLCSVVIWGLCDAASAAMIYSYRDPRVSGMILLNPWVHTDEAAARVRISYYYVRRLMQPSLWMKFCSGRFRLRSSLSDLLGSVLELLRHSRFHSVVRSRAEKLSNAKQENPATTIKDISSDQEFIARMLYGLQCFQRDILFILAENDLIAREFLSLVKRDNRWRIICRHPKLFFRVISDANHTFASHAWRQEVSRFTIDFVKNVEAKDEMGRDFFEPILLMRSCRHG